jgi:hypothetical protein
MNVLDLPISFSRNVQDLPRKEVATKTTKSAFASGPGSKVRQLDPLFIGGPCFVDLPYRDCHKLACAHNWDKISKTVFVKGRPDKLLFSDRLDSGLSRFDFELQKIQTTESRHLRSKLLYGDLDFRVWLEVKLPPPGKDRLPKTKVLVASHYFHWRLVEQGSTVKTAQLTR